MDNVLSNIFHTQVFNSSNTVEEIIELANNRGIDLTNDHWEAINVVKYIYQNSDFKEPSLRELKNLLKQKYQSQGGYRHLYQLFPEGPIDTISYLAGIKIQRASNTGQGVSH